MQHKDGDYFYPLTTIDQVIMEDGLTRLSGADLVSVNTDGAPEGEVVGINADTLGGYAADAYVKKTDGMVVAKNYSVVGSVDEPTNPTENMIWVQTENAIGKVYFSGIEPSSVNNNDVRIYTGNSSSVAFDAIKIGNDTMNTVYPISAKQYVSGKWEDKTAKSYQGGKWVDWITYLYNLGDECEDITGGWTVIREGYGGSFTNSGEELVIQSGGAQNGVFCTTKNKVDLTNAKTVHFSVSTATGTSGAGIGYLVTNANSSWNDWQDLAASTWSDSDTVAKEYPVDVTNVTPGEYYIGFICYGGSDRLVGCNKIWFS